MSSLQARANSLQGIQTGTWRAKSSAMRDSRMGLGGQIFLESGEGACELFPAYAAVSLMKPLPRKALRMLPCWKRGRAVSFHPRVAGLTDRHRSPQTC